MKYLFKSIDSRSKTKLDSDDWSGYGTVKQDLDPHRGLRTAELIDPYCMKKKSPLNIQIFIYLCQDRFFGRDLLRKTNAEQAKKSK